MADLEIVLNKSFTICNGELSGTISRGATEEYIIDFEGQFYSIPFVVTAISDCKYSNGNSGLSKFTVNVSDITHTSFKLTLINANDTYAITWALAWRAEAPVLS